MLRMNGFGREKTDLNSNENILKLNHVYVSLAYIGQNLIEYVRSQDNEYKYTTDH